MGHQQPSSVYFLLDLLNTSSMRVLSGMLVVGMLVHLLLCPFTKVEESFNLQAMHDVLHHRWNIHQYDHLEFPGVVPRTFLGPLVVAVTAFPAVLLAQFLGLDKFTQQFLVRGVLGMMVMSAFLGFCRAVKQRFSVSVMRWLVVLTLSQFHFLFYITRPLPNTFALALVLLAMTQWLRQRYIQFAWAAGAACIIFRFECLIFLGLFVLSDVLRGKFAAVFQIVKHAVPAAVVLLGVTVLVDSVFWQRWLWPEGEVMWFNVYLNKSSEWGTSPFWWYFYSVLPRALLGGLVLCAWGCLTSWQVFMLVCPAVVYVLLFSCLPHKELRFIVYTFPVFNTAAAFAAAAIWRNRSKSLFQGLKAAGLVGVIMVNFVGTSVFLATSRLNYPGGQALAELHNLERHKDNVNVHIDVYTAQTGVSRFTQLRDSWSYNKTEDLAPGGPEMMEFTHLMIGALSPKQDELTPYLTSHTPVHYQSSFNGLAFNLTAFPFLSIKTQPSLWILKKKKASLSMEVI